MLWYAVGHVVFTAPIAPSDSFEVHQKFRSGLLLWFLAPFGSTRPRLAQASREPILGDGVAWRGEAEVALMAVMLSSRCAVWTERVV